ncbi:glutamate synthase large subunit [Pseudoclavibacter sp. CFCC 13611]|uniref:glutamate synthase large subunit n=1 Tax=Pseudoclavibacter sp. CFCC 13611 TaxID=2615178 RepID=UPI0013015732|nr:glutamate synthase large subunit [Pseudoclavibacter sp. CFCC 13611]KAB1663450.1 glutamate synthase large subunit [Pseudoclavibacter sp. CFCC 13611]
MQSHSASTAEHRHSGTAPDSEFTRFSHIPGDAGLYRREAEKDACGLAMVATLRGTPGHDIVDHALNALRNLEHRGAVGSDAGTGDGAGILLQIPHRFFSEVVDFALPDKGEYAAGMIYLPLDQVQRERAKRTIDLIAREEGLTVLGWREVPTDDSAVGTQARETMPAFEQIFVARLGVDGPTARGIELDRIVYRLRRRASKTTDVFIPSLSSRTIVYKGMVTTLQLEPFFPDLSDERFETELALVHSRYSTNTFPSWPLAQPFRMIAHNGEINTVKGNRNSMRARQADISSPLLGDLSGLTPLVSDGGSDSASFDETLELLHLGGRSLPHAVLMMVPEAWEHNEHMDPELKAFYAYHATLIEPWDGPAAISFTDGTLVGATLDRNGLRPGRYVITRDGLVVVGSETGVIDVAPENVMRRGRLQPGRMFLVDTKAGRIVPDREVKQTLAEQKPWKKWLDDVQVSLKDLPEREHILHTRASVSRRQRTFGYTEEDLTMLIGPMAKAGAEPLGAMGTDTPIAALSEKPRLLFDYFTQTFAQVTNPPLDSIREQLVTALSAGIGPEQNLLSLEPASARQVRIDFPVITNDQLAKIQHVGRRSGFTGTVTLRSTYPVHDGVTGLRRRLDEMCDEALAAVQRGVEFIVISDRDSTAEQAPIPSLLAIGAINHHLVRQECRRRVGLIAEAGDVREVHHVATLLGYGASAVNPYLAMESAEDLVRSGLVQGVSADTAVRNLIKALGKGVLKIMSKMGISTVASYVGAQTFEAVGISQEVIDEFFTGTVSKLGGIGLLEIEHDNARRHALAYPLEPAATVHQQLPVGGEYKWRRDGSAHLFNPDTIFRLQHCTKTRRYDIFKEYTDLVDDQSRELKTIRGLFRLRTEPGQSIPIDEVEPASELFKRFSTGAMSYGSISQEAHQTLAIAMNRIGGKSNTGEGGEDLERLLDPERRSSIKQVASGRFGVTSMYLAHADDLQIKLAQGAKPGEGGQLPGAKMYPWIARTRHSTAGVGLISPPPHHDIYSIEDLKQLIFDLKRANPKARIHVKLVSENGIGAVAAGVAKAKADVVLVSGHDGGTGASPLNSLKHAGTPWEIGLAETQQTLQLNGLRDRVVVQADGQLKTGRDVIIAALLGAEEFGFATTALVVEGCIMMRVCHKDTCPVGVATQNPELRSRFTGKAEHVVTFFEFIAQQVREYMAELGVRTMEELIGRTDLLDVAPAATELKAQGLDLDPILHGPELPADAPRRHLVNQDHELEQHFDNQLIALSQAAIETGEPVHIDLGIRNTERAVGTMLGYHVTMAHGAEGLPDGTIDVTLHGSAGQSLGAFLPHGVTLRLEGDSNDYVGKGLSGGQLVLYPPAGTRFVAEHNVIAGNVIGYGATSGTMLLRGLVGERFLVRNSGATAVVEGVGDHALEYMTGGVAVILGRTGRNIGAGMSGGIALVHDLERDRINVEALAGNELQLLELDADDIALLHDLLERHRIETGSTVAERMLADFDETVTHFTKLLPTNYARVLRARSDAEAQGLDPDGAEVWNTILEVTRG